MGHKNQPMYLLNTAPEHEGPILEIGSKDYGNTQDFRSLFTHPDYTGLDLEPGKNVDVVHNLEDGPLGREFGMIVCCSVLEHTPRPWIVAEHITQMLKKGGKLYLSVPWVQRYHAYPEDYFRFSYPGIKSLFPELSFSDGKISTFTNGEFMDLEVYPDADSFGQCLKDNRAHLPCYEIHCIGTKNGV